MTPRWSPSGRTAAVGSLPHRSAEAAAAFALRASSIPTVPSLPRRSPAESMILQVLAGVEGIDIGPLGSITGDPASLDASVDVTPRLDSDAFVGMAAFLRAARAPRGEQGAIREVSWHVVGPVTLGLALVRIGVAPARAFDLAAHVVARHLVVLADAVAVALPGVRQIAVVDEPSLGEIERDDAHLAPDTAVDLVSRALASIEGRAITGVHCCASVEVGHLVDIGADMISMPLDHRAGAAAARLGRFLDADGVIAWGAIATSGPLASGATRPWRQLGDAWAQLVDGGVDPYRLCHQAVVTPECGLALHSVHVAHDVFAACREVGRRVTDRAAAMDFAYGA